MAMIGIGISGLAPVPRKGPPSPATFTVVHKGNDYVIEVDAGHRDVEIDGDADIVLTSEQMQQAKIAPVMLLIAGLAWEAGRDGTEADALLRVDIGSWAFGGQPESLSWELVRTSDATVLASGIGAAPAEYPVVEADRGQELVLIVTATNDTDGSQTTATATVEVPVAVPTTATFTLVHEGDDYTIEVDVEYRDVEIDAISDLVFTAEQMQQAETAPVMLFPAALAWGVGEDGTEEGALLHIYTGCWAFGGQSESLSWELVRTSDATVLANGIGTAPAEYPVVEADRGQELVLTVTAADDTTGSTTAATSVTIPVISMFTVSYEGSDYMIEVDSGYRDIEIDADRDGDTDLVFTAEQMQQAETAPVMLFPAALAWGAGEDGTEEGALLHIYTGCWAFGGQSESLSWELVRTSDATVLANGIGTAPAEYPVVEADRGQELVLTVTAADDTTGSTPAATSVEVPARTAERTIVPVALDGATYIISPGLQPGASVATTETLSGFVAGSVAEIENKTLGFVFCLQHGANFRIQHFEGDLGLNYIRNRSRYGMLSANQTFYMLWRITRGAGDSTTLQVYSAVDGAQPIVHFELIDKDSLGVPSFDKTVPCGLGAGFDGSSPLVGTLSRIAVWDRDIDPGDLDVWDSFVTRDIDGNVTGLAVPSTAVATHGTPLIDHYGNASYWNALPGRVGNFTSEI